MASAFTTAMLDEMLNGVTVDRMTLHSGSPGADGTGNVISAAPVVCSFSAAEADGGSRKRALASAVEFTGATGSTTVAYFGLWKYDPGGNIFKCAIERTSGDVATNSAGEYNVTTATKFTVAAA